MDSVFHFLSHEEFTSLPPLERVAYLDRAVLELERLHDREQFTAGSAVRSIGWQIPSELESYL